MPIRGEDYEALQDALVSSLSSRFELQQLLRFDLDLRLDVISPTADHLVQAVYRVIEYCDRAGHLVELVTSAKNRNPGNPKLAAFDSGRVTTDASVPEAAAEATAAVTTRERNSVNSIIAGLESEQRLTRVAAAAQAKTWVSTGPKEDVVEFLPVLLAAARSGDEDAVLRNLVRSVADALARLYPTPDPFTNDPSGLDLARAQLPRVELSAIHLVEADVAFAKMHHAQIRSSDLFRVKGYAVDWTNAYLSRSRIEEGRLHHTVAPEAQFHECRMISVFMKHAELSGAEFQRATLQGAHFEEANLTGASFWQSNISDADFSGATIDAACAESLAGSFNWDNAKFDATARALIESFADN